MSDDLKIHSEEVMQSVSEAISLAKETGSILAVEQPEAYAKVCVELAKGKSLSWTAQKTKTKLGFVSAVKLEAALAIGKVRKAFAYDSARITLMSQSLMEEHVESLLKKKQMFEEANPDDVYEVTPMDLNMLARVVESTSKLMDLDTLDTMERCKGDEDQERLERARELRKGALEVQEEKLQVTKLKQEQEDKE